jgi:hypothetical protein
MMRHLYILVVATTALLAGCALLPRREISVYPGEAAPGPAPAGVFVDSVEVDRRILSKEVARDVETLLPVLAPVNGFALVPVTAEGAWALRVHVVEREMIRDFSPLYSIMVSIEMFSSKDSARPALTVVHTSESTDSVSSPWTLKKILNECLREAAKTLVVKQGG